MNAAESAFEKLTPAQLAFADKVFDAFDVQQVVTAAEAAKVAGVHLRVASEYIEILRAARSWPYRSAKWRFNRRKAAELAAAL